MFSPYIRGYYRVAELISCGHLLSIWFARSPPAATTSLSIMVVQRQLHALSSDMNPRSLLFTHLLSAYVCLALMSVSDICCFLQYQLRSSSFSFSTSLFAFSRSKKKKPRLSTGLADSSLRHVILPRFLGFFSKGKRTTSGFSLSFLSTTTTTTKRIGGYRKITRDSLTRSRDEEASWSH